MQLNKKIKIKKHWQPNAEPHTCDDPYFHCSEAWNYLDPIWLYRAASHTHSLPLRLPFSTKVFRSLNELRSPSPLKATDWTLIR